MTCENKKLNKRNQKRTRSPPRLSSADTVPPHSSPAASRKRRKEMHRRGSGSTHKRPSPLSPCVCRYRYLWVDWHLLLLLYKTSSNSEPPIRSGPRALGDVRVTDVSSYISSNPYPRLRQSRGSETPIVDVNLF